MSESPGQQFFIALFNTRNRVRFAMDEAFRPMGITDATWRALFYLEQTGSGVSQKELATVMGIEGPSLVRLLDSLEARQLIERRADSADRRVKSVHLTPKAEPLLVRLRAVSAEVRDRLLARVDSRQLLQCIEVFDAIRVALDEMEAK